MLNLVPMAQALFVQEGTKILLHYTLSTDSEVLESTEGQTALELVVGSGRIHPLIERHLLGRKIQEDIEVVIDPSLAFGEVDGRLILQIPKHKLPEALRESELGSSFEAAGPDGHLKLFRCIKLEGPILTFDGNHELAGIPLFLSARILRIG